MTFTDKRLKVLSIITPFHLDTIKAVYNVTKNTVTTHKIIEICCKKAVSPYAVLEAIGYE